MKRIYLMAVVTAFILFSYTSCSVNNSVDLNFQYKDYSDTIHFNIDSLEVGSFAINISVPIATTKNPDFNDKFNSIYKELFNLKETTEADSIIPAFVEKEHELYNEFTQDIRTDFNKDDYNYYPVSLYSHEYILNSDISLEEDADIINLVLNLYIYEGGAHGMSQTICYNISAHDGHRVDLQEIYDTNQVSFVLPAIKDALVKQTGVSSYDQIHTAGYFDDTELYIPENYIIRRDSVDFYYNAYEIAPYYIGTTKVTIPRYGIK